LTTGMVSKVVTGTSDVSLFVESDVLRLFIGLSTLREY